MFGLIKDRFKGAKRLAVVTAVGGSAAVVSSFANATGVDLTPLTGAVDFSTVTAAVLAIAGSIAAVYVVVSAAKIVIARIKAA
ncbi:hypothetical protein [Trinickia soli]|uniref:hypothetical protein n=1 Tax=Trinickia soli TaxID=380675 RepID=UPI003FA3D945